MAKKKRRSSTSLHAHPPAGRPRRRRVATAHAAAPGGSGGSEAEPVGPLQIPEGTAFLRDAGKSYDQVLAFDHPTLSVSPVLNGLDLARRFAGTKAKVDVIAHGRGGLVRAPRGATRISWLKRRRGP